MKDATRVGFASALYSLTKKEDLKSVDNALDEVSLLLEKVPEFKKFLLSYDASYENKKEVITNTFSSWNIPNLVPFLCLIAKYHGYDDYSKIAELFHSYSDTALGITRGIVFSRFPLDKVDLEKIESSFEDKYKKVKLKNIIDYSLIGGIKVTLDGKVYDYSLKNRLDSLGAKLLSGGNSDEN